MSLKTKTDYVLACRVVKTVIDEWDPYALLAQGAPADEFNREVAALVPHIRHIRGIEDAAQAVSHVFSAAFEAQDFGVEACRPVGSRLFDALVTAGFLPSGDSH